MTRKDNGMQGNQMYEQISNMLHGKEAELNAISESADARALKRKLSVSTDEVLDAMKNGRPEALKQAIETVVKSDEGKRLLNRLQEQYGRN